MSNKVSGIFGSMPIKPEEQDYKEDILLWRAVLDQALYDALYCGINKNRLQDKLDAEAWFENRHEDDDSFLTVVDMAGLKEEEVMTIYRKARENPKWLSTTMATISRL